jgi:hypothetical protein
MSHKAVVVLDAVTTALFEAIAEFGASGVPSGHLYAAVMKHMSLETYETVIEMLVKNKRVCRAGNHVLVACK